jgi:hypothetical protein
MNCLCFSEAETSVCFPLDDSYVILNILVYTILGRTSTPKLLVCLLSFYSFKSLSTFFIYKKDAGRTGWALIEGAPARHQILGKSFSLASSLSHIISSLQQPSDSTGGETEAQWAWEEYSFLSAVSVTRSQQRL